MHSTSHTHTQLGLKSIRWVSTETQVNHRVSLIDGNNNNEEKGHEICRWIKSLQNITNDKEDMYMYNEEEGELEYAQSNK